MSKNIIVFSDGTGQDGGVRPDQRLSNVYKMYRSARVGPDSEIDPARQVAFYDPGLGTDDDVRGFGRISRTIGKVLASVAGRGIGTNIVDCYEFVLSHWRPGDRIYVMEFSRGAYTARCLAQVISLCGVPTHEAKQPGVPFSRFARATRQAAERAVHQVYEHGAGHPIAEFEAERDEQARRFREDYGSADGEMANAYPYFVGVFDTVAALGAKGWKYWGLIAGFAVAGAIAIGAAAGVLDAAFGIRFLPTFLGVTIAASVAALIIERRSSRREINDYPEKGKKHVHHVSWHASNYDRGLSGHVGYARHAKAIDEDRADFPHVAWGNPKVVRQHVEGEPEPLVQLWFSGNHSDIGGSYPEVESRLSDISLRWMVEEAESLPEPVLFDRRQLTLWPDPTGMQHSEVQALRDSKLWWVPRWAPVWLRDGWPYAVRNATGGILHPSVLARLAGPDVVQGLSYGPYRPDSFRADPRFAHLYDGSRAASPHLLAAAGAWPLRLEQDGAIQIGVADPGIADVLAREGAVSATVVTAADPSDPWDGYGVDLRLRELDRTLAARDVRWVPVHAQVEGRDRVVGRLVFDLPSRDARELARASGRSWLVEVGKDGAGALIDAFD
jgi:hypothetical protein